MPTQDIGASEIDEWHRDRGWTQIGYHYVIRRSGEVENGRDESQIGAHAAGYNADSIGICLVGGIGSDGEPESNFTFHQYAALATMLTTLQHRYPNTAICGHRDLPGVKKDCPCFDVQSFIHNPHD